MKKKGFTLVELLAVIIILGVIALITTPIIMNSVNDARRKAFENSIYGLIRAIDNRRMSKDVARRSIDYKINVGEGSTAIEYSGELPEEGWAHIDADGNITIYVKTETQCGYKDKAETGTDDVIVTNDPDDCTEKLEEIRDNVTYAEIREDEIIDGEEPEPTTGYSYEPKTGDETYAGILYLDPTDLSATCNATAAAANVNNNGTPTNIKTGCMKWFVFGNDGNGNPTTAILDHNTTAIALFDFDDGNNAHKTRTSNRNEADWQLIEDTKNWDSVLEASLPTGQEIADAAAISNWKDDSIYTYSLMSSANHWWLYTNLNDVEKNSGRSNDNNTYTYYTNENSETSSNIIKGYWTSTIFNGTANGIWYVCNTGDLRQMPTHYPFNGVRPVISLSSLNLSN